MRVVTGQGRPKQGDATTPSKQHQKGIESWVQGHKSSGNRQSRARTTLSSPQSRALTAGVTCEGLQGTLVAREKPRDTRMLIRPSAWLRITLTEFAIPNQLRPSSAAASKLGGN